MMVARRMIGAVAVALILSPSPLPASAQGVDCPGLQAEIAASDSEATRSARFSSALRRQQAELERAREQADAIGCDSSLFGDEPAQCEDLSGRINQLQAGIAQLEQQFQSGSAEDSERQRALRQRYDTACRDNPDLDTGGLDQGTRLMPEDTSPDDPLPVEPAPEAPKQVKALCVRHCDGGFFPITDQASSDKLDGLDKLCKALCPNAEASLYTAAPSAGIETAVAADGSPYTALPAAFKYQKSYDSTCSCKPPHQSWVEALADAEKLLESDKGDVTVTQQMSDAMSRPATRATSVPKSARKAGKVESKPQKRASTPDLASENGKVPPAENAGEEVMRQLRRGGPTF